MSSTNPTESEAKRHVIYTDTLSGSFVLVAAFRYAIGRMTYAIDAVAIELIAAAPHLNPKDRELIAREIKQADLRGAMGMQCDRDTWMRVLSAMTTPVPSHPQEPQ